MASWSSRKLNSRYQFTFIITYGRSGSTLLSGLLNSIDGWLIRGENNNFLFHLFRSFAALSAGISQYGGEHADIPTDPWWGINEADEEKFKDEIRKVVARVLLGNCRRRAKVLGFKEIRYPWVVKQGLFDDYLNFLKSVFPNTTFIFNYRNLDDVMQSKWWAEGDDLQREDKRALLENFESAAKKYAFANAEYCFEIQYKDLIEKSEKLRELFAFLGEYYDEQTVNSVLDTKHSY